MSCKFPPFLSSREWKGKEPSRRGSIFNLSGCNWLKWAPERKKKASNAEAVARIIDGGWRMAKNNTPRVFICLSAANHLSLGRAFYSLSSFHWNRKSETARGREKKGRAQEGPERDWALLKPTISIRYPHAPPLAADVLFIIPHAGARSFLICCDTHHHHRRPHSVCWGKRRRRSAAGRIEARDARRCTRLKFN